MIPHQNAGWVVQALDERPRGRLAESRRSPSRLRRRFAACAAPQSASRWRCAAPPSALPAAITEVSGGAKDRWSATLQAQHRPIFDFFWPVFFAGIVIHNLKIKKSGRNSNLFNSKNKSSKVRKVKKKNWVFFFCFFCNRRTSYKFLTQELARKMKFLTSKKEFFLSCPRVDRKKKVIHFAWYLAMTLLKA